MVDATFDGLDIGLYSISSTADNRAVAQKAETRGFKRVWLAEDHHSRDLIVQATAVAVATKSIEIGLGIVNPFTRHPAQIAMAVADIEEMCGPRMVLGLGAAHSAINAHGLDNPRPITALKEAGEICSRLLQGERVVYEGEIFRLPAPGAKLRFPLARSRVPIYFGTMGPPHWGAWFQTLMALSSACLPPLPLRKNVWGTSERRSTGPTVRSMIWMYPATSSSPSTRIAMWRVTRPSPWLRTT